MPMERGKFGAVTEAAVARIRRTISGNRLERMLQSRKLRARQPTAPACAPSTGGRAVKRLGRVENLAAPASRRGRTPEGCRRYPGRPHFEDGWKVGGRHRTGSGRA